jgi:hypothetical protein
VTLAGTYRLPVFRQESRYRHLKEWTTLAENQWTHDGRKLTPSSRRGLAEVFGTWERISSGQSFRLARQSRQPAAETRIGQDYRGVDDLHAVSFIVFRGMFDRLAVL